MGSADDCQCGASCNKAPALLAAIAQASRNAPLTCAVPLHSPPRLSFEAKFEPITPTPCPVAAASHAAGSSEPAVHASQRHDGIADAGSTAACNSCVCALADAALAAAAHSNAGRSMTSGRLPCGLACRSSRRRACVQPCPCCTGPTASKTRSQRSGCMHLGAYVQCV